MRRRIACPNSLSSYAYGVSTAVNFDPFSGKFSASIKAKVRYQLKTPYRDGTTHVVFEPLDFIARLAALTPKPRVNLTRFHGVFAPNSKHRALVTPAKRGKGNSLNVVNEARSNPRRTARFNDRF